MEPRLQPLSVAEFDADTRDRFGDEPPLNIFATLARHPKLLKRWLVFGNHVLMKSTLSARDRELLILRTGWLCSAPYEWGQHVVIARAAGMTDDEITRLSERSTASGWSDAEGALVRAADELHASQMISDATYSDLTLHYNEQQLLDIVFTVGQYTLVSMALNTFRVERDDGVSGVPVPERQ